MKELSKASGTCENLRHSGQSWVILWGLNFCCSKKMSRPPSVSLLFDQPFEQEACWSVQLSSHSPSNETDHRITEILAEKDLWRSSSSTSHLEKGFCQHWIRSAVALSRPVHKTSKDGATTAPLVSLFQGCSTLPGKTFSWNSIWNSESAVWCYHPLVYLLLLLRWVDAC